MGSCVWRWLYPSDLNTHSCLRVGDTIASFASIHSQSTLHVGCVLDECWGGKRSRALCLSAKRARKFSNKAFAAHIRVVRLEFDLERDSHVKRTNRFRNFSTVFASRGS